MMREVYGSIGNYWRALAGLERHGLTPGQRASGIAWSVALLPFQIPLPAFVAWRMHANEAKRIRAYRDAGLAAPPDITAADPRSTFA